MDAPKILIVDDEIELRELISYDFEAAGFEVTPAENGKIALDLALKSDFDAIISDIRMPVMTGIDFLKNLRSQNKTVPVVFVSAFSDSTLENALDLGANGMFPKPFDRRALIASIKNALLPMTERWRKQKNSKLNKLIFNLPALDSALLNGQLKIGRGGLSILSQDIKTKTGEEISFEIVFENDSSAIIEGDGKINWIRKESGGSQAIDVGLEFSFLKEKSLTFVVDYIGKNNLLSFIPK